MPRELTAIAILRDAVDQWRRSNGWSRETVAQWIVEAHERIDGPMVTGIKFNPPTTDPFERMRVNADRVYRWLDDVTKDRNHLPANMLASVLAALPMELRRKTVDRLLRPAGLAACALATEAQPLDEALVVRLLRRDVIETAEANEAVARLIDGAQGDELADALRQVAEAIEALQTSHAAIEAAMTKGNPCGMTAGTNSRRVGT